ncbi:MAG: hypothetical protein ABIC57_02100 [bacterium]
MKTFTFIEVKNYLGQTESCHRQIGFWLEAVKGEISGRIVPDDLNIVNKYFGSSVEIHSYFNSFTCIRYLSPLVFG